MKSFVRKFSSFWRACIFATMGPLSVVLAVNLLLGKNWFNTIPFLSVLLLVIVFSYATLYFTVAIGIFIVLKLERLGWLIPTDISEEDPETRAVDVFKIAFVAAMDELKKIWTKNSHGEDKTEALGALIGSLFVFGMAGFVIFFLYSIVYLTLTY